mmetsp:Transcript_53439/g.116673  ORF Transcript_53439/g.116673 Transcript_53439/m.116673 type:complete len:122 (+) Transcript_53439:80-445(+)
MLTSLVSGQINLRLSLLIKSKGQDLQVAAWEERSPCEVAYLIGWRALAAAAALRSHNWGRPDLSEDRLEERPKSVLALPDPNDLVGQIPRHFLRSWKPSSQHGGKAPALEGISCAREAPFL